MRSALFCDVTQRRLVVIYRRCGTTYWSLKMGPIGCPAMSVTNYESTVRKITEERRPHLHRGWSLKPLVLETSECEQTRTAVNLMCVWMVLVKYIYRQLSLWMQCVVRRSWNAHGVTCNVVVNWPFKGEAYLFSIRTQCVPRCKHSPLRL
jgi:hypothetical protein